MHDKNIILWGISTLRRSNLSPLYYLIISLYIYLSTLLFTLYYYQLIIMIFIPLLYFNLYFGFDFENKTQLWLFKKGLFKDEEKN
jgi:hypothetical protein